MRISKTQLGHTSVSGLIRTASIFVMSMIFTNMTWAQKTKTLSKKTDSLSYAMGADLARELSISGNVDFNPAAFAGAFRDYKNGKLKVSPESTPVFMEGFEARVQSGAIKKCAEGKFLVKGSRKKLQTAIDSFSYYIGLEGAKFVESAKLEIQPEDMEQGVWDFGAGKLKMDEVSIRNLLSKIYQQEMPAEDPMVNQRKEENLKKGQAFLEKNREASGIIVHPSGIQYRILREGSGISPQLKDEVTVHYAGRLISGKEFDSSYKRGEPATFPLYGLIQGWQVMIPQMKEGAKWEIFLPPQMAYGEMGAGADIGPNETLIFEIELIKVIPK